jgi:hypothetical protein
VDNYHWFAHLSKIPGQPTGPEKHRWLMDALQRHGQGGRPVWLTETYQLTLTGQPATLGDQVEFLTHDLVEMLALPEIERVYWYSWVDNPPGIGDADQIGRGLIGGDRVPKPAALVLPFTLDYTNGIPEDRSTADVRATAFRWYRTPLDTMLLWSRDGASHAYAIPARPGKLARVRRFPVDAVISGDCCPERLVAPVDGAYRLDVGGQTLYVDFVSG